MNVIIENIPKYNTQLDQYKSSIDVLINQNNEYLNSIKRYSNKDYNIQIDGNITSEKKIEIENMIDQLEDINKRNDLMIQQVDDFIKKIIEMKQSVIKLKIEYLTNKTFSEKKIKELNDLIIGYFETMEEEEIRKIKEKYNQMKSPFQKTETEKDQLNSSSQLLTCLTKK